LRQTNFALTTRQRKKIKNNLMNENGINRKKTNAPLFYLSLNFFLFWLSLLPLFYLESTIHSNSPGQDFSASFYPIFSKQIISQHIQGIFSRFVTPNLVNSSVTDPHLLLPIISTPSATTWSAPYKTICDRQPGPIVGYAHHKAGSTWLLKVFRDICHAAGMSLILDHDENYTLPRGTPTDPNFANRYIAHRHCIWRRKSKHPPLDVKGFHVVRDPRDMVVSGYYSHKSSHPPGAWLDNHRQKLQSLQLEEGITEEIRYARNNSYLEFMNKWPYKSNPLVLELKFEMLTNLDTQLQAFVDAFSSLGIPACAVAQIPTILKRWSLERLRRDAGGNAGHYRQGRSGNWKEHFNENHKMLMKDCCSDLLVRLGY